MNAYTQLIVEVYYEEIVTPLLLSFALVVFLICTIKKVSGVSQWKIAALFTIGFVSIIFWPHAGLIIFPEPCMPASGLPTAPCHFSPWVRVKLGLFYGTFGALLALLSWKTWQFLAKKLLPGSPETKINGL
ncbi:hypothetical protein F0170_09215 [Pseudomonas sp. MAFF 730085]|uniref:Uncharacterized protein n=1 Tax=Pseudomonas kitaguniensis TaxID=2607908 RepID=A0A5N7JRY6_9PSED|nr:hypothetical protein [Pseudomonas kitaguniensis]MPQ84149.1 hypothetical protein [Pseudomonas kitaguniensis]